MPSEVIITREKENGLHMWQRQWTKNTGKEGVTKAFFPSVRNKLRQKISIFLEFATTVTGHGGALRSYLHGFALIYNPKCPYEEEE
jgi:hypothetical protein